MISDPQRAGGVLLLSPFAGSQVCMDIQEGKEFDPTIHTAEYVVVEHDESFAQIRDKIEEALGRTPNVILIIPRGATAFHTTQDFLALGKLQWRREVRVAVATPDPTIAGLARVLGFHIVEPPADHPALAGDPGLDNIPSAEDEARGIEKPTSPLPLGSLPGMPEWVLSPTVPGSTYTPRVSTSGSLTTSTWLNMPGDGMSGQHSTLDASPPATRAGQPPPRKRPRQTGQLLPTQLPELVAVPAPDTGDPAVPAEAQEEAKARLAVLDSKAYRSGRGWRYGGSLRQGRVGRVLVSLIVVLTLLLVAASGYAYVYLPEGVVSVIPQSKTINGLPVHITVATGRTNPIGAPEGPPSSEQLEPGQIIVSAQSLVALTVTQTLVEESTAPATGTRQIARGRGAGTMHFVNTTGQSQLVPEGTIFNGPNGISVQTTQDGTVRPTDFVAQQFGTLDLPIVATVEGPDGNIEAGKIVGTYKGVLTYANYAMQGGSIETVQVVTQEDVDKLTADLKGRVEGRVNGAILEAVASMPGQKLIAGTIHLDSMTVEANHNGGDDGEAVTVKVTGVAIAYTYDEARMNDAIRQAIYDHVQSTEPANFGPVTDLNSIDFLAPAIHPAQPSGEQGVVLYSTTASARVRYTLTPTLRELILETVKGQSVQEVPNLIARQPFGTYVTVGKIEAKVLWFNLDKLPEDATRIAIQQSGGNANTITSPQPDAETGGDQR
jgi:hypothetical protein